MPGEMKPACSVVLTDVWLFLDDELDVDARAAVQRHLDDCSPCLEEAGLDQKLKMLLHSKCGGDLAPAELRERLVTRLRTITAMARADGDGSVTSTTVIQDVRIELGPGAGR
ncbi:mycothiol system anti-sigma-R factor [Nakamurella flavida]|uniref:Mycothiol system anti-sigma-R factor n=1 Tax=Nakamurella flavida TaxID=363630 RepID=A0A939C0S1_9ACTN|nr:mycothiol system anti-sigma-R factor [Nakamurella flavida]MBM9477013.1 mycothiol system anti-sigma-R factor [Nakamurella flavida]MDP9779958.1 mycothiol system anti-sigma-R factor [Nakamurella flavida]